VARITFIDDVLETKKEIIEVKSGSTLKEICQSFLDGKNEELLEFEVYNSLTGESSKKYITIDEYKIVSFVNGEEKELDTVIKEDDNCVIMYFPQGSDGGAEFWSNFFSIGGTAMMLVGSILCATGVGALAGGILMAVGAGCMVAGAIIAACNKDDLSSSSGKKESKQESEELLSLGDGGNRSLVGQRYPFSFGKHLMNPGVAGSAYHVSSFAKNSIYNKDGESQYFHKLYTIGYGPRKITDIKLGNVILSYNGSYRNQEMDTVFHGQLKELETDDKAGEILKKWKNNDPTLELLQMGGTEESSEVYGTIYPQVVEEREVNEPLIFIHDAAMKKVTSYKNTTIDIGFRSNTVKFSHECPSKIEVELEAPQGLYGLRTKTEDKNQSYRYYKLPVTVAVQWRFIRHGESASDAESGEGWQTFDYVEYGNGKIEPVPYCYKNKYDGTVTYPSNRADLFCNKGVDKDTSQDFNEKWDKIPVFSLNDGMKITGGHDVQRVRKIRGTGRIRDTSLARYPDIRKTITIENSSYLVAGTGISWDISDDKLKNLSNIKTSNLKLIRSGSSTTTGWFKFTSYYRDYTFEYEAEEEYTAHDGLDFEYPEYKKDGININGRRWVFTKEFTDAETRILSQFHGTDVGTSVEIRAIRLTPNYLDENRDVTSGEKWGLFSYQDMVKWTYLRTYCFDKKQYIEALNDATVENLNGGSVNVHVSDYPLRPFSLEDSRKMSYIALSLKQDAMNTAGSNLNDMSCIVQSIGPKYNPVYDEYAPATCERKYKYSQKIKTDTGWIIQRIDKDTYEKNKLDYSHFWKENDGTDIIDRIKQDISEDFTTDKSNLKKYLLTPEKQLKYISNKTSDIALLGFTGAQNGIDQYTYDYLDLAKWREWSNFCDDITDTSPEQYSSDLQYQTDIDLMNRPKIPNTVMKNYFPTDDWSKTSVSTVYSITVLDDNENPSSALVMTPIKRNSDGSYKIYTASEIEELGKKYFTKNECPEGVVLYKYNGSNCLQQAENYAIALHIIQGILYDDNEDSKEFREILNIISKSPINALRSGVKEDYIKALCLYDNLDPDLYTSYILDVIEQHSDKNNTKPLCELSDGLKHFTFRCNGVINNEQKLEQFMTKVMLTGRASLVRNEDNKYSPLIGKPNPYPVALLNQRNVISRSNSKLFADKIAGLQYKFVDESDNYLQNDLYVMDDGEDWQNPSAKMTNSTLEFVTDRNQLYHLGRYNLAAQKYQLETYNRTVGPLGYALALGDTVLLQDDSLLVGTDKGGRIQTLLESNDYIYGFITDEPYKYTGKVETDDTSDNFGLSVQGVTVVQPEKYGASRCVTQRLCKPDGIECDDLIWGDFRNQLLQSGNLIEDFSGIFLKPTIGLTNVIIFEFPIAKSTELSDESNINSEFRMFQPSVGNLVSFGDISTDFIKATLMNIKPKDKDQFDLTLVPYTPGLYTAGGDLPIFEPKMTRDRGESVQFNTEVTPADLHEIESDMLMTMDLRFEEFDQSEPPLTLTTLTAYATKDGLTINGFIDSQEKADSLDKLIVQVSMDDGENWSEEMLVDTTFSYEFNRDDVGYPEKAAFSTWKVRAKGVSVFGLKSPQFKECKINTSKYGTWLIPDCSLTANAYRDNITINVTEQPYDSSVYYRGPFTVEYSIKKGNTDWSVLNKKEYFFNRNLKEYPEISDLRTWVAGARYVSADGKEKGSRVESAITTSGYGTWLTPKMTSVKAVASADKIEFTLPVESLDPTYYYAAPFVTRIKLYKGTEEGVLLKEPVYNFVRNSENPDNNEYLEKDELESWRVEGYYESFLNNEENPAPTTDKQKLNLSSYGTWKVTKPVVDVRVSGRVISMVFSQSKDNVYGNVKYGIRVCKTDIDKDESGNLLFYKPNVNYIPYVSVNEEGQDKVIFSDELGYKLSSEDYFWTDVTFSETMALTGQSDSTIADTQYAFEVIVTNGVSNETYLSVDGKKYITVIAQATSIVDVVYGNSHTKNAYVEALSAITANVGLIKEGGFGDFDNSKNNGNYWALTNLYSSVTGLSRNVYKGEFRVGGEDEYIIVKPKKDADGQIELDENYNPKSYTIEFKVGNFTVKSDGNDFTGNTVVYDNNDKSKRLKLTSTGIVIEKLDEAGEYEVVGRMQLDAAGNMFITNNDKALAERRVKIPDPENDILYHFDDEANLTKDSNGGNAGELVFSNAYFERTDDNNKSPVSNSVIELNQSDIVGYIEKDVSDDCEIGCFTRSDTVEVMGDKYKVDGTNSYIETLISKANLWGITDPLVFKEQK